MFTNKPARETELLDLVDFVQLGSEVLPSRSNKSTIASYLHPGILQNGIWGVLTTLKSRTILVCAPICNIKINKRSSKYIPSGARKHRGKKSSHALVLAEAR